jgi:hypothetical protein
MTPAALQKFTFDTEFDDAGAIAREAARPKRMYSPEEVEAVRQKALADGRAVRGGQGGSCGGRRAARDRRSGLGALATLAEVAHAHKEGCAQLSLTRPAPSPTRRWTPSPTHRPRPRSRR